MWPLEGEGPRRSVSWRFTPATDADGTGTLLYPHDFPGEPPLLPLRRHGFRITREPQGVPVGEGRFETLPARPEDTPAAFTFGLLSCHQPFLPSGEVRPLSVAMLEAARHTLESHDARFLLLSVPMVYVASWASVGISLLRSHRGDARDRWTHPWNLPDRDRLLGLLLAHQRRCPGQRVVLLSGDVHLGCAFAIDWLGDPGGTMYQFTSSAVTHLRRGFSAWAASHLLRTELLLKLEDGPAARLVRMDGVGAADRNPYCGLNVGVVEVHDRGTHATVRFKLVGQDPRHPDQPVTVFDTGEL